MERSKNVFNQAITTAFLVVGMIAISAVAFKYSGDIQLKLGPDGIQLQITGQNDTKSLK